MKQMSRALRQLWRATHGNAAVEFAIIIPILLMLVVAVYDLGTGFNEKLKLQSALNSGMQHAMQTHGSDVATTKKVIEHLMGNTTAQINVASTCRCGTTVSACTNSCNSGVRKFVSGSASKPYVTALMGVDMSVSGQFEVFVGYK